MPQVGGFLGIRPDVFFGVRTGGIAAFVACEMSLPKKCQKGERMLVSVDSP